MSPAKYDRDVLQVNEKLTISPRLMGVAAIGVPISEGLASE